MNHETVDAAVAGIPAMTPPSLHYYLADLGERWSGRGVVVEVGCWLGASCAAIACGLRAAGYKRPIYCYDRWIATVEEQVKARAANCPLVLGQNLEPLFRANVERTYPNLVTRQMQLANLRAWGVRPIEILIVDAAKREPLWSRVMNTFTPHLCSPATLVLCDYDYYRKWPEGSKRHSAYLCQWRWVQEHAESVTEIADIASCSARVFRWVPEKWNIA